MSTETLAIYEDGKLRPLRSLPLSEGETVRLTVNQTVLRPALASGEVERRMQAAMTLDELFAAFESAAAGDTEYDLLKAIDANRLGERPLFPPELKGVSW